MKNLKYIGITAFVFGLVACNDEADILEEYVLPEQEAEVPPAQTVNVSSGSANFSTYVALGASFTSGYTDNALFIAAQENSYPNMLSQQFAKAGGGSFTQPMTSDNFGGLALGGDRIADPRLVFNGAGPVGLESVIGSVTVTTDIASNNPTGPFNNLGVPGAKSFHLLAPGFGNINNVALGLANPYFVRMTGTTPDATVLELAAAQDPTFFTLPLLAGNDVLGYATAGGDQNIDQITDMATFEGSMNAILGTLMANGAKGVVSNVPYVTTLPFFTAVPHNIIPLDEATASAVNAAFAEYNGGLLLAQGAGLIDADEVAQRTIAFGASATNPVLMEDEFLTDLSALGLPNYRLATADDLLVLTASSFVGTLANPDDPLSVNGLAVPLADRWVITPEEQTEIITATDAFNTAVQTVADASDDLAFVDLKGVLDQLNSAAGYEFSGKTYRSALVTGGAISLDGIHLTAPGYAVMAYEILKAIDEQFGSDFIATGSYPDANSLASLYLPTLQ